MNSEDRDDLAGMIGRVLAADPDSPVWRDERLLTWLAEDAQARQALEGRWPDAAVMSAGRAMLARVTARQFGLAWTGAAPPIRQAAVPEPTPDAVWSAARESTAPLIDLAAAAGAGREIRDEPVESFVQLPSDTPRGRYVALKIAGDSMVPLMHSGDTVLVRLDPAVKRGHVIVARHPDDGYVSKVVSRIRARTIELTSLDPARAPVAIPRDSRLIVGMVVRVWCPHDVRPAA